MFGKPHWFKPRTIGWGLNPITWQGWVYSLIWVAVLVVPFCALLYRGQRIESAIWFVAALVLLIWDTRQILKAMDPRQESGEEQDDLFVIDENETESRKFATRSYEMHLRE